MMSSSISEYDEYEIFPTPQDQKILQICVRIAAGISLMFACHLIYSVLSQKYYRQRIFHRIMMGCSINIILLNIMELWGQAAVPYGTPGFPYARGTQGTCTTQGFFFNMALVAPLYYSALSILCYLAFSNKYQLVSTSKWIEFTIHVGVYVLSLAGSFYLLSIEAYNPSFSVCAYGSYPVGCGDQSPDGDTIPCERGPQNFGQISRLLGGLQIGIFFLLPTVIMFITFCRIRLLQGPIGRNISTSFAIQSIFYLSALYITYIPKFIFWGITFKTDTYVFGIHLFGNIFEALMGVWFYLPYYYFRSDPIQKLSNYAASSHAAASSSIIRVAAVVSDSSDSSSSAASSAEKSEEKSDRSSTEKELVVGVERRKGDDKKPPSDDDIENNNKNGKASNNNNKTSTTTTTTDSSNNNNNNGNGNNGNNGNNHATMIHRPTFSIFDGSSTAIDPNSPWSKYLYDDFEDDSYREDCGEYDDSAFINMN